MLVESVCGNLYQSVAGENGCLLGLLVDASREDAARVHTSMALAMAVASFKVESKPFAPVSIPMPGVAQMLSSDVPRGFSPFTLSHHANLVLQRVIGVCERQHKRGSLLPNREGTDGMPQIPLRNPQPASSVLE